MGYGTAQSFIVSLALVFAVVAVIAVALYALGQRSGKRPKEAQRSVAWLAGAAIAIWVGLAAIVLGSFLVDEWLYSENSPQLEAPDPETLTEPCADADADTITQIEAKLVGDPAPTIAEAKTAVFNISGDESRVIVAGLVGPGVPDDAAVFLVDPSGMIYSANGPAQAFSTFETVTLNLDVWDEPLGYASRC
jgi:hypothetical protein